MADRQPRDLGVLIRRYIQKDHEQISRDGRRRRALRTNRGTPSRRTLRDLGCAGCTPTSICIRWQQAACIRYRSEPLEALRSWLFRTKLWSFNWQYAESALSL